MEHGRVVLVAAVRQVCHHDCGAVVVFVKTQQLRTRLLTHFHVVYLRINAPQSYRFPLNVIYFILQLLKELNKL